MDSSQQLQLSCSKGIFFLTSFVFCLFLVIYPGVALFARIAWPARRTEGRERTKGIKRFIVVVIVLIELALDEEHVVSTCRVNDER